LFTRRAWSDGWAPSWAGDLGRLGASQDAAVERWMRLDLPHDMQHAAQAARNDFELRAPLLDYDLVDFAARLPRRHRDGRRLLRSALAGEHCEEARRAEGEAGGGHSHRFLELLPGLGRGGGLRGWRPPDLSSELRRDATFQRRILQPFLEGDCFPDDILDRSAAWRLFAEHRCGAKDHTAVLGALVTVALVYRLFVEGGLEAPAAPRGYPEPAAALEAA
jgi:hypothetical protein